MEKLTLQDCFKYPNAGIINKDKDIVVYSGIYYWIWASVLGTMNISDCKLILRPLSSLTDEEKFRIGKIAILNDDIPAKIKYIDYLRSINIDIDGLQERGLCIYE